MPQVILVFFQLLILTFFVGFLYAWGWLIWTWYTKRRILPEVPRRPLAPWGLLDLAIFVFVWFYGIMFLGGIWNATRAGIAANASQAPSNTTKFVAPEQDQPSENKGKAAGQVEEKKASTPDARKKLPSLEFSLWIALSQVIAMVVASLWLCKRANLTIDRIGWDWSRLVSNLVFGTVAGLISIPFMYLILLVLTNLVSDPGKHPLVEQVNQNPSSFVYAFIIAVVIAPITEEFMFRVLLQGYLDSMSAGRISLADFCVGRRSIWPILSISYSPPLIQTMENVFADSENDSDPPPSPAESNSEAEHQQSSPIPPRLDGSNESHLPSARSKTTRLQPGLISIDDVQDALVDPRNLPWWPILVSGFIFGLVHYSYGIGWIPLILFGFLLGWLYRMTGTIWASWIVHVMLNSMSLMALYINLFNEQVPKS